MSDRRYPNPGDTKLDWFSVLLRCWRKFVPAWLRDLSTTVLAGVTPNVPVTLFDQAKRSRPVRALVSGLVLGWVFCFGGTVLLTAVNGSLFNSSGVVGFFGDVPNIINYTVVCPLYLGLSGAFIVLVLQAWNRVRTSPLIQAGAISNTRLPVALLLFFALTISAAVTLNYIDECLDPAVYEQVNWYVDEVVDDDVRVLGAVGVYYVILNFSLLFVAILAVLFLIPMLYIANLVAASLRSEVPSSTLEFSTLREVLREFTLAYIYGKLLAAVFLVNAFTWKMERPIGSVNFFVMASLLTTVGVFVVSFPRYYVELEWFHFKVRRAEARNERAPKQSDQLRDRWIRHTAAVLDTLFGFSTILALWGLGL